MRFIVVDTETTGFTPKRCHVWDVVAVVVEPPHGRIVDSFRMHLHPPGGLPEELVQKFGWDASLIDGCPPSDDPASWEPLWRFLAAANASAGAGGSVLVAHNLPFDLAFLEAAGFVGPALGFSSTLDTLAVAKKVTHVHQPKNLRSLVSLFGVELDKDAAHGALADAMALAFALPGVLEAQRLGRVPAGWLPLCVCGARHPVSVVGNGETRCDKPRQPVTGPPTNVPLQAESQPAAESATAGEVAIMVNKVTLVGNLGADPEIRTTNNGNQIGNLRVATTHRQKTADGEYADATEWHRVTLFGRDAENASKYLKKGRQVDIEGRIQTRKYQDKDGQDKYATEIIANEVKFMSGGRDGRDDPASAAGPGPGNHSSNRSAPPQSRVSDDDIPF